jgi:hypothetical protein
VALLGEGGGEAGRHRGRALAGRRAHEAQAASRPLGVEGVDLGPEHPEGLEGRGVRGEEARQPPLAHFGGDRDGLRERHRPVRISRPSGRRGGRALARPGGGEGRDGGWWRKPWCAP